MCSNRIFIITKSFSTQTFIILFSFELFVVFPYLPRHHFVHHCCSSLFRLNRLVQAHSLLIFKYIKLPFSNFPDLTFQILSEFILTAAYSSAAFFYFKKTIYNIVLKLLQNIRNYPYIVDSYSAQTTIPNQIQIVDRREKEEMQES